MKNSTFITSDIITFNNTGIPNRFENVGIIPRDVKTIERPKYDWGAQLNPGDSERLLNSLNSRRLLGAAKDLQYKAQVPLELSTSLLLSVGSVGLQGIGDVEMPHGQIKPCSNYTIVLSSASTRKSAAFELAFRPIEKFEMQQLKSFDEEIFLWKIEHKLWKKRHKQLEKMFQAKHSIGKVEDKDKQEMFDFLKTEPKKPVPFRLIVQDTTIEGLCKLYSEGQQSLGAVSAEGDMFFSGYLGKEYIKTNLLWGSESFSIDRASSKTIFIVDKRLTLLAMIQTGIFDHEVKVHGKKLRDSGKLARLKFVEATPVKLNSIPKCPLSEGCLEEFHEVIEQFLQKSLLRHKDTSIPRKVLSLSDDANQIAKQVSIHIEDECDEGGSYENAQDHARKLCEVFIRDAAIIHEIEGLTGDISVETLNDAITINLISSAHFIRRFGQAQHILDARLLDEWIDTHLKKRPDPIIRLNELMQICPEQLREKKRFHPAVRHLANTANRVQILKSRAGGITRYINLRPDISMYHSGYVESEL